MSAPRPEPDAPWLDELAALARQDAPPPLDPDRTAAMVRRAITESGVRRSTGSAGTARPSRSPGPARGPWRAATPWLAAAAVALLAVGVGWALRSGPTPLHATLPTGDAIDATPGASFELRELTPAARRVAVLDGTVLFDVAPLGGGESFVVETVDARVEVRGTVFSVERSRGATRVRVYEGRVDVVRGDQRTSVPAGRMWARAGAAPLEPGPLGDVGRRAAARRATEAAGRNPSAGADGTSAAGGDATTPDGANGDGEAGPSGGPVASGAEAAPPGAGPGDGARPEAATGEAGDPASRRRGARASAGGAADAPTPAAPSSDAPTPDEVRRWIAAGRVDEALAVARGALAGRPGDGTWRVVLGDALEAAGDPRAAADAYDAAARTLPAAGAARAAFLSATIRFRDLGDPRGAIRSLDTSRAAEPGSALAERALGLRARAHLQAGDRAAARRDAARYLEAYPAGSLAEWARALAGDDGVAPAP